MRLARMYSFGVALSFALLALLTPTTGRSAINGWIVDALRSASWVVAGLSALSAARELEPRDELDGFSALAALRGSAREQRSRARALATALRIALGVCVPGLAVLGVGALRSLGPALLPWLALWLAFIVAYSLVLGATLALLARASARLLAQQARLLLVCVVFVPELVRALGGFWFPSLPAACAWLLGLGEAWGRAAS
jgi:hypothetical protein